MIIETQLSEKEFISVNLTLYYRRTGTIIMLVIVSLFLLLLLLSLYVDPEDPTLSSFILPFVLLLVLPLLIYFASKKAYKTNHQMRELVAYSFEKKKLVVTGETYTSTFAWSAIYKVTQTKHWILIRQTKQKTLPIKATDLWGGQVAEIKDILDSNGVKNNLKYLPT